MGNNKRLFQFKDGGMKSGRTIKASAQRLGGRGSANLVKNQKDLRIKGKNSSKNKK